MIKIENIRIEDRLGKEYLEHSIFNLLDYYIDFYDSLSFAIMGFVSMGTTAITNMDTYAYSSMRGTIESIKDVLKKGRINDAYALLRKYYDSTIINVYTNLYLQDNRSLENFIVSQIDNWLKGIETIPEYRIISKYIKDSPKLFAINKLLQKDDRYKKIRDRCNDHTHYNFYKNYLLNDNEIYNPNRIKYLNVFARDVEAIFIQHLAYTFYLNDHYMSSSDYMDCMEIGMQPDEDSQYWVAPFVQEVFDKIIKVKRHDIAEEIKQHTMMQLE
jgi:hypothetical protein